MTINGRITASEARSLLNENIDYTQRENEKWLFAAYMLIRSASVQDKPQCSVEIEGHASQYCLDELMADGFFACNFIEERGHFYSLQNPQIKRKFTKISW